MTYSWYSHIQKGIKGNILTKFIRLSRKGSLIVRITNSLVFSSFIIFSIYFNRFELLIIIIVLMTFFNDGQPAAGLPAKYWLISHRWTLATSFTPSTSTYYLRCLVLLAYLKLWTYSLSLLLHLFLWYQKWWIKESPHWLTRNSQLEKKKRIARYASGKAAAPRFFSLILHVYKT